MDSNESNLPLDWDSPICHGLRFMIGDGRPKAVHVDSSGSEGRSSARRQLSQSSERHQMLNPLHVIDDIPEAFYRPAMIEVRYHPAFDKWLAILRDQRAADRIVSRIGRARFGHMGDVKTIGGIGELRIDCGPGYRVYFVRKGQAIIILLCGGDKSSQQQDIDQAISMAKEVNK